MVVIITPARFFTTFASSIIREVEIILLSLVSLVTFLQRGFDKIFN